MKTLTITLAFLFSASTSFAGTAMNMEGSCSGKLTSQSSVRFTYYSNFDGCKAKSSAAVSFESGNVLGDGLITGSREFIGEDDIYTFTTTESGRTREQVRLTFANMTNQTSAKMRYRNPETGKYKTITLKCDIRNYEYAGCR